MNVDGDGFPQNIERGGGGFGRLGGRSRTVRPQTATKDRTD
jgi:hypothetical protein